MRNPHVVVIGFNIYILFIVLANNIIMISLSPYFLRYLPKRSRSSSRHEMRNDSRYSFGGHEEGVGHHTAVRLFLHATCSRMLIMVDKNAQQQLGD